MNVETNNVNLDVDLLVLSGTLNGDWDALGVVRSVESRVFISATDAGRVANEDASNAGMRLVSLHHLRQAKPASVWRRIGWWLRLWWSL